MKAPQNYQADCLICACGQALIIVFAGSLRNVFLLILITETSSQSGHSFLFFIAPPINLRARKPPRRKRQLPQPDKAVGAAAVVGKNRFAATCSCLQFVLDRYTVSIPMLF